MRTLIKMAASSNAIAVKAANMPTSTIFTGRAPASVLDVAVWVEHWLG